MLFLDWVYVDHPKGTRRSLGVKAAASAKLTQLRPAIAYHVDHYLER